MTRYRFHWFSGDPDEGYGDTPEQAFNALGYGYGAIRALDYWEIVPAEPRLLTTKTPSESAKEKAK